MASNFESIGTDEYPDRYRELRMGRRSTDFDITIEDRVLRLYWCLPAPFVSYFVSNSLERKLVIGTTDKGCLPCHLYCQGEYLFFFFYLHLRAWDSRLVAGNEESDLKKASDFPSLVLKKWMFWRLVSFIECLAIALLVILLLRATWAGNNYLENISIYNRLEAMLFVCFSDFCKLALANEAVKFETVVFHSGLDNLIR